MSRQTNSWQGNADASEKSHANTPRNRKFFATFSPGSFATLRKAYFLNILLLLIMWALLVAGCEGNIRTWAPMLFLPPTMPEEDAAPEPAPAPHITPPATPTPTASPTLRPTPTPTKIATTRVVITPSPTPTATATPTLTAEEAAYINLTPTPGVSLYQTCMLDPDCTPPPASPIGSLQETENILFLGTDRREGWDSWRTDTIMLVVIDHETNQMAIISFPRDLYVYHPQIGKKKINVLDHLGEKYGLNEYDFRVIKETFAYNFGIHIDHVVRVHRDALTRFVDAIGGIDITLDCDLWEISPKDGGGYHVLHLPAGVHHLDGEKALQFATFRYRTSDWGRARRQQAVIAAIKEQALQLGILTKAPALWEIVKNNVSSDIGFLDMLRYAQYGISLDMSNIHSHVFSNRELTHAELPQSGAYVLFPKEKSSFSDVLENIFAYVSIKVQGTHKEGCPPTPTWADEYLNSVTPTP